MVIDVESLLIVRYVKACAARVIATVMGDCAIVTGSLCALHDPWGLRLDKVVLSLSVKNDRHVVMLWSEDVISTACKE